jgi:enamine deaminase RidA (YjgF/YER057c/UK114 family)
MKNAFFRIGYRGAIERMPDNNIIHDIGVAARIGKYSDAIEVAQPSRFLFLSGTPGLDNAGRLPDSFEEQADQAWRNIFTLLQRAGMGPEHLVKVTQYLTRQEDIASYPPIRARWLGDHRPASMLSVIPALVWPEFLIEIEVIAATSA